MPAASARDLPALGAPGMPRRSCAGCSPATRRWRCGRGSTPPWRWLAQFLRNCDAERFARNKARMQRIAHYSKRLPHRAARGNGHRLRPQCRRRAAAFSHRRGAFRRGEIDARTGAIRRRASHPRCRGRARDRAGAADAVVTFAGGHAPARRRDPATARFTVRWPSCCVSRRHVPFRYRDTRLVVEGGRVTPSPPQQTRCAPMPMWLRSAARPRRCAPPGIDLPIYPVKAIGHADVDASVPAALA